ncbi:hypothetical protein ACLOJK_029509 [Asimina triloba]
MAMKGVELLPTEDLIFDLVYAGGGPREHIILHIVVGEDPDEAIGIVFMHIEGEYLWCSCSDDNEASGGSTFSVVVMILMKRREEEPLV